MPDYDVRKSWVPTAKNAVIRASTATNRLRVGGTGSSKTSDSLMEVFEDMLRWDGLHVLFIRRKLTDLKKSAMQDWQAFVPAELYKFNQTDNIITLYNGSKLFWGHLPNNSERDLQQYLSAAFERIVLDECGQFSGESYAFLQSRNRLNPECKPDDRGFLPIPCMLGNTNPIGAYWPYYKAQFVDRKPYDAPEDARRDKNGRWWTPDGTGGWILLYDPVEWAYVHSTLLDNPHLMKRDPSLLVKLNALPGPMRDKLLSGTLDSTVGQYFDCWDESKHVVDLGADPTRVIWQPWQPRWMGWDYGRVHWNAEFWFTIALVRCADGEYREKCVVYREYMDKGKTSVETLPNTVRMTQMGLPGGIAGTGNISQIFFSHEKFSRSSEKKEKLSIAERITKRLRASGLPVLTPNDASPGSRIKKASTLYEKLRNEEVVVLSTCHHLIEAIPQLVRDEKNIEDVLKVEGVNKADDCYDAFTMGLHNFDFTKKMPWNVALDRELRAISDPTARSMVAMKREHERKGKTRWSPQY